MAKRYPTYSRYTRSVLELLGEQIKLARIRRGWSEKALAERSGVDRGTVRNVEAGNPRVAIGTSFEIASLVGVPLFSEDQSTLSRELSRSREMLALLPKKVQPKRSIDDDF
jgi:transcriptional regulator with XRE-family HTH domain